MSEEQNHQWPTVALGSLLLDIQTGYASGVHNSSGNGLPHFRPMNVSPDGRIDRTVLKYVDPSSGRSDLRLRRGDVLFNNTNSPELVGKTALFEDDDAPAFSNHMTRLRVAPSRLDPGFLALRLHQTWREGWFATHCNNHVSQASIGRDVLRVLPIELPPLEVQREVVALAHAIDYRRVSSAKHLSAARQKIERFRQSILDAACSGRLTAEWRDNQQEDVNCLVEALRTHSMQRRKPLAEPQPNLVEELPATWETVSLDLLIDHIEAGKSFSALGRPADESEWGIIKVSAMSWGHFLENENKAVVNTRLINPAYEIEPGDLLLSRANTEDLVGATVLVGTTRPRLLLSDKSLRLIPHPGIDKGWLNYVLRSPLARTQFAERATGTSDSMRNLSQEKILATTVPLPPTAEQREIARRVDELLRLAERLQQRIQAAERRVERSSQAVLAKAFRGELLAAFTDVHPAMTWPGAFTDDGETHHASPRVT